jgi:cation diffusion facilitator family transporter
MAENFQDREKIIVRTSIIGIAVNMMLAAFKAAVGLLSNSIAVVLDAVNNLSDALSSVITIIGAKLAGKRANSRHPFGHGRIEYISALLVSVIVLYAGFTSLVESVKKIIHPEVPDYSTVSLVIIASAVVAKLLLGRYVKGVGKNVNSASLVASGADALNDAIISLSVLASALVYTFFGISLEAYVGVLIAVMIIKAGFEMVMDSVDDILGKRTENELTSEIKKFICREPDIYGAFDLILHSYGPDRYVGSVHIEVPDTMTVDELDQLERKVAGDVYQEFGIILTGIGIYSHNTKDDELRQMRSDISRSVMSHEGVHQIHGFFADKVNKTCSFDVIIDYDLKDRDAKFSKLCDEIKAKYPEYIFNITMDIDI